jgi:hypothetical protein
MRQTKGHSCRGASDIQHGNGPLQPVMSRLMEEVAESDHARGLACEVHRQRRSAAAEHPGYGVQFLPAATQIVAGYDEIGRAEGGVGGKQNAIVAIPESVLGEGFRGCDRLEGLDHRGWSDCPGLEQRVRDLLLRKSRSTKAEGGQQSRRCQVQD